MKGRQITIVLQTVIAYIPVVYSRELILQNYLWIYECKKYVCVNIIREYIKFEVRICLFNL